MRVQQQGMAWRALLHEHRRLLVTSYRHCASGKLTAEERTGQAPFRVLMAVYTTTLGHSEHQPPPCSLDSVLSGERA